MDAKYIKSLITLLDDPDAKVFNVVAEKIVKEGNEVIPILENVWEKTDNILLQNRIEELIDTIQYNHLAERFSQWAKSADNDLLEGTILVARLQYPDLNTKTIYDEVERLRRDIWLELNNSLTALEKVKIINHILFKVNGYKPNTSNYYSPQNHFINNLIESKQGGPIILSLFYGIIAQKLGLPIYCVNLPHNFVLAYKDRYFQQKQENDEKRSILFYINPFNYGSLFGAKEIELFLSQQKIEDSIQYYLPCSNQVAIMQLLYNATVALQRSNRQNKAVLFSRIQELLINLSEGRDG